MLRMLSQNNLEYEWCNNAQGLVKRLRLLETVSVVIIELEILQDQVYRAESKRGHDKVIGNTISPQ